MSDVLRKIKKKLEAFFIQYRVKQRKTNSECSVTFLMGHPVRVNGRLLSNTFFSELYLNVASSFPVFCLVSVSSFLPNVFVTASFPSPPLVLWEMMTNLFLHHFYSVSFFFKKERGSADNCKICPLPPPAHVSCFMTRNIIPDSQIKIVFEPLLDVRREALNEMRERERKRREPRED